jgi:hypothetical protein
MRCVGLFSIVVLAGCPLATGPSTGECNTDGDCNGNVCARDGFCHPRSTVREVKTTWTIRGQPASELTCGTSRDLAIGFSGVESEHFAFAPVPCEIGQFVVDKLPFSYTVVELGRDGGYPDSKSIGSTNAVAFDLRL